MPNKAEECPVCDIAQAFAVGKGVCNTFKEKGLDCKEFLETLKNPDGKVSTSVKAFQKMRKETTNPKAREALDWLAKAAKMDDIHFEEEPAVEDEAPAATS
jgi:phage-related minor tail protein